MREGHCERRNDPEQELRLPEGHVEVDVHAVGINFKDVAVSMELIPADESKLGLEGAGVIRRLGDKTVPLEVGQRVLINKKELLRTKFNENKRFRRIQGH